MAAAGTSARLIVRRRRLRRPERHDGANTPQSFDRSGFNDRARSSIVFSGTWQAWPDAFQGDSPHYGPGRYDSLGGSNGQTSSARPMAGRGRARVRSGSGAAVAADPQQAATGGGGQTRVVDVRGSEFSGRSFVLTSRRTAQFRQRGLQRQGVVNSRRARVLGGSVRMPTSKATAGRSDCRRLTPTCRRG